MSLIKKINQILLISITGSVLLFGNLAAEARLADTVRNETNNPIPVSRTEPFDIYFPYGDPRNDVEVRNAIGSVTIDKPDLEFVTTGFEDWFYGDPDRNPLEEDIPTQATCNAAYSGPKYDISASFATTNTLTYGLQSAYNGTGGSQENGALNVGNTGCIKAQLRVSSTATPGSIIEVIFDEDSAGSPDYLEENRPGRQIIRFAIGASDEVSSSSSSSVVVSSSSSSVSSVAPVSSSSSSSSSSVVVITPSSSSSSSVYTAPFQDTTRSGGPGIFLVLITLTTGIISFIMVKTRRKKLVKIDLDNNK